MLPKDSETKRIGIRKTSVSKQNFGDMRRKEMEPRIVVDLEPGVVVGKGTHGIEFDELHRAPLEVGVDEDDPGTAHEDPSRGGGG